MIFEKKKLLEYGFVSHIENMPTGGKLLIIGDKGCQRIYEWEQRRAEGQEVDLLTQGLVQKITKELRKGEYEISGDSTSSSK